MTGNERYITQLTQEDMKDLAALTRLSVGEGLELIKKDGQIIISINMAKLNAILGR